MAGIYVHIPYCKTKCPYCDFFSVTQRDDTSTFVQALLREIYLQGDYLCNNEIKTLYFGGGTPSLLQTEELKQIYEALYQHFNISEESERTIECNPDDVSPDFFKALKSIGFNRLSLGIQSFHEDELEFLERRHDIAQNDRALRWAFEQGFQNTSIDLIYGLPGSSPDKWKITLEKAFQYSFNHLSAYHLTIELNTVFGKKLSQGELQEVSEENSLEQFRLLMDYARHKGFEHYELSSFSLPGCYSRHNTAYWMQKPYLGLGPSAHSYDGRTRQWNVSNVKLYNESVMNGKIPCKKETLTTRDHFNEYLITRLRTQWGVDLDEMEQKFGKNYKNYFLEASRYFLDNHYLQQDGCQITLTRDGKFISDAIFREMVLSGD